MTDQRASLLRIRQSCLDNATRHLQAAILVKESNNFNVAFECALLALEEVGKAFILMMTRSQVIADNEEPPDWMDDHVKKLFWAIWSVAFGKEPFSESSFRSYQGLAKQLHQRRLQCAYVNYDNGELLLVSKEECQNLIDMTESRLSMELAKSYEDELSSEDQANLKWLLGQTENSDSRSFIWSWPSLQKLHALDGNVRAWVIWLKSEVKALHEKGQELLRQELQRKRPTGQQKFTDKWKARLTLFSASHSIRQRALNDWNKQNAFIQMFPGGGKNELRLEINLSDNVLVSHLWQSLFDVTTRTVLALNIGASGFFWWYLPEYTNKFYEKITDLESKSEVSLEAESGLSVDWGHHALKKEEFGSFGTVFAYLLSRMPGELKCFEPYMRGLAAVAKADLFIPLQANALIEFRNAAHQFLTKEENDAFDLADLLISRLKLEDSAAEHLKSLIDLASKLGPEKPQQPVTLTQALQLKLFFDALVILEARSNLQKFKETRTLN